MQVIISFILGVCFGIAFMTIITLIVYIKERRNNIKLAKTIKEISEGKK